MKLARVVITGGLVGLILAVVGVAAVVATGSGERLLGDTSPVPAVAGTGAPHSSVSTAPAAEPRRPVPTPLLRAGDRGLEVRELQARLVQVEWLTGDVTSVFDSRTSAAVRGFQAKRGYPVTGEVDQRTWNRLVGMTATPTRAAMFNLDPEPGALDPRCLTGRVLCIDKTSRSLRWVVDGAVRLRVDVRFGATSTPTREGVFAVYLKSADHVSRLYGSSMPFAMFFSGGQAVHYSSDFASVGYAGASHGCVNVRDWDGILRLFGQVRVGDKVVVYWS